MTNRIVSSVVIFCALVSVILLVFFSRRYLAGIEPVISTPRQDVVSRVIEGDVPFSFPSEFKLSLFAEGLTAPRVIAFDPSGTLLVSIPDLGRVVALPDPDGDGRADRKVIVAEGLNQPHGLAFYPQSTSRLYIAETDRVVVFDYDPETLKAANPQKIIDLPGGGRHSTRTLLFLPPPHEGELLISVGSSCDVCVEDDWRRAAILIADEQGRNLRSYATGLRNAVFMRRNPETDAVWATEMGRDYLGDDLPPDEINIIQEGHDYGWPYCYGDNIRDQDFTADGNGPQSCGDMTPSFIDIQAHSAPLGLDFFPAQGWPEKYRGSLLVAYHGSWNRSVPTGYKVVLFILDAKGIPSGREDFITGWLTDKRSSLGRPADISIRKDGMIYITDDKAGTIYRLALTENATGNDSGESAGIEPGEK